MLESVRDTVNRFKDDELTIYYVARNPDTPVLQRLMASFVSAYAFSPIDLLPDFIPLLGYLDDFLLAVGFGWFVLETTPQPVLDACREKARTHSAKRPKNYFMSLLVLVAWIATGILLGDLIKHLRAA